MEQYIKKSDLVAEIKERIKTYNKGYANGDDKRADALEVLLHDIANFEVKEVNLDSDIRTYLTNHFNVYEDGVLQSKKSMLPLSTYDIIKVAKYFFELGLNASNPTTEVNLESIVREVIGLYFEAGKHYDSIIKEERKEYGGSDLAIKLLDGVIDAEELGIQYVLDKLKAQKGE